MVHKSCPICKAELEMPDDLSIGIVFQCTNCKEDLEIIWLLPLTLDAVYQNETLSTPVLKETH